MRTRCVVTAKCVVYLAVTAAGGWQLPTVALYRLLRVLGRYWGGPELKTRNRLRHAEPLWVMAARWLFRIEVGVAAGVETLRAIVGQFIGAAAADGVSLAVIVASLAVPRSRQAIRNLLVRTRARRRWTNCLAVAIPEPATPTVSKVGTRTDGEWAEVRIGPGSTVKEVGARADAIAAALAVTAVRVEPHSTNAGWAVLHALRVDPLLANAPPWPWLEMAQTSLWTPVPVGVDEAGRSVTVRLAEHNLLLGGEPGAGKSVALSQLVAAAALDPDAGLWLLDGKLVELVAWRPAATGWAGTDIGEALAVLRQVAEIMDARYRQLLDTGRRKLEVGSRLHVVVIDELAHYLTWGDKKPRDAFTDVLRDLVSRGRAAGIVVIAATQKPSSDVVPTSLRDLYGYRWALRCTTNAASDTILGSGWATEGMTAASISPDARGVGLLLHESGLPTRLRAHHLNDAAIAVLAGRAAQLRGGRGLDDDRPAD